MVEFIDAVSRGDLNLVDQMLAADPALANCRTESGETVIQRALYYGHRVVAERLLAEKPTLDMGTACAVGDLEAVKSHLSEVNSLSGDGFTPLCLAAAFGHMEILTELLHAGADVHKRSNALGGVAPIHSAVFGRKPEIVRLLLEHGADPNMRQEGGFTPLHGAAQNGDRQIVSDLLIKGADPTLLTDTGKSARDLACDAGEDEVAAML